MKCNTWLSSTQQQKNVTKSKVMDNFIFITKCENSIRLVLFNKLLTTTKMVFFFLNFKTFQPSYKKKPTNKQSLYIAKCIEIVFALYCIQVVCFFTLFGEHYFTQLSHCHFLRTWQSCHENCIQVNEAILFFAFSRFRFVSIAFNISAIASDSGLLDKTFKI